MTKLIKYVAFVKEILKGHMTGRRIPILVTLCVTNRCNIRCVYCYEEYYERNHKEFTTQELLDLIDELAEMGAKYISINGGEALLRKDIEIIIDKVNANNMLSHITSNGILVKKNISVLKKVDSMAISIDGNKESNDANRGKGTYDHIIEAFECLRENRINFQTNTVLTKNNQNTVDEIMDLALKYGFKAQFSILRKEDSPNGQINLDNEEIKAVLKQILDYKKKGLPIFFSYNSYRDALNWPFTYNRQTVFNELPDGYKNRDCYLKRFACQIEANGLVYPCVVLVNKIKALNFQEVGFKKAWKNLENCDCKLCYNICHNDLNNIFGLKPEVVWNAFKIVGKRLFHGSKSKKLN